MHKKIPFLVCSLILVSFLTGCVLNVDSDRSSDGSHWSENDVSALQRGETSSDWVLRNIGIPDNKIETEQGGEIWQYLSHNVKRTDVSFIFLFHFDIDNETNRHLNIEVEEGKVLDYWVRSY